VDQAYHPSLTEHSLGKITRATDTGFENKYFPVCCDVMSFTDTLTLLGDELMCHIIKFQIMEVPGKAMRHVEAAHPAAGSVRTPRRHCMHLTVQLHASSKPTYFNEHRKRAAEGTAQPTAAAKLITKLKESPARIIN
jgi:hypothetical protein